MNPPRLMLAAPASGAGKTTFALGLLGALSRRGLAPAAFKCGPDYLDPLFHRLVPGVTGGNLDLFFTPPAILRGLFCRGAAGAGISVLEGAMGYYDGIGMTDRASAWRVATATETPAVLVVRPRGVGLTLAATVAGLVRFRPENPLRGLVLNRCGAGYADKLAPLLERETGLRVYGSVRELPEAAFESRHLGLAPPDAANDFRERVDRLAAALEQSVDVPGLVKLAGTAPALSASLPDLPRPAAGKPRIAVARDAAFSFYYPENLDLLRALGADLVFFSPLADRRLPEGVGGLYIGGGYPELHARELAENAPLRRELRLAIESGLPTLAEGGGFLYLQNRLADPGGREWPMLGVVEGTGRNAGGLRRFGYIRLRALRDTLLCAAGEEIPAHEFHHWDSGATGDACVAAKASGEGEWRCVVAGETLFAGFPHLYFWSNPAWAGRFVAAALGNGGE